MKEAATRTFSFPGLRNYSLQETLLFLVALSLPLVRQVPAVLTGLLLVNWFFSADWKSRLLRLKQNRIFLLPSMLYLLCLTGMLYTSDTATGWRDLETKASLLVIPLVLFSTPLPQARRIAVIMYAFVAGCIISMVLCLSHSAYLYFDEIAQVEAGLLRGTFISTEFFFASRLSWFIHPSYCAMYLNMAMIWIFYTLRDARLNRKNIALLLLNAVFTVFIFFLTSKTGMITSLLSWLIYLVYFILRRKWYLYGLLFFILLSGGVYLLVTKSEIIASRFKYAWQALNAPVDLTSSESSAVRLLIWKAGREVISENLVLGVGTGDLHAALDEKYAKYGMTGALSSHLNAHSQYFQTFIVLGLPGILTLMLMLLIPAAGALKTRTWPLLLFVLLFSLNILVESMLELEAGVLFFSFFYSLLTVMMLERTR